MSTHTVVTWFGADKDLEKLYRTDTGISVADRQGPVVIYGSEPNRRKSYIFMTTEKASFWLREIYPRTDLMELGDAVDPSVDIIDGESVIVVPAGSMEIASLAPGVRGFNKSIKTN